MLVLHFDYTSLAAVVAVLRLQALADAGGAVGFQGIDVLGVDAALPVTLDQLDEIDRWRDRAAAQGLTIRQPSRRPPTLGAHLIGDLAARNDLGAAWRDVVLRAYWTGDAALEDRDVLVALAAQAGLDPADAARHLADPRSRMSVRQRMTADRGRGIGGVPMLEFNGTLLSVELAESDLRDLAGL
jgi:predicted DsbA family dithiol-disulfide isomerase